MTGPLFYTDLSCSRHTVLSLRIVLTDSAQKVEMKISSIFKALEALLLSFVCSISPASKPYHHWFILDKEQPKQGGKVALAELVNERRWCDIQNICALFFPCDLSLVCKLFCHPSRAWVHTWMSSLTRDKNMLHTPIEIIQCCLSNLVAFLGRNAISQCVFATVTPFFRIQKFFDFQAKFSGNCSRQNAAKKEAAIIRKQGV